MPETHYVEITCANGSFSYTNDGFEMEQDDRINWTCPGDHKDSFIVIVLQKGAFEWDINHRKRGQQINERLKDQPVPRTYKYYVIVTEGENLWIDDPTFIVRPPR